MTIQQVREFFLDKKLMPCPLTEELVFAGYQQVSGGYIDRAKKSGIKVNYKDNAPPNIGILCPIAIVEIEESLSIRELFVGNLFFGWQKPPELLISLH